MLNSVKLLTNIGNVNVFDVVDVLTVYEGSYPIPFYVRLWQEDSDQRYIPAIGATVTVEFLRMKTVGETNDSQDIVKALADPYAEDRSIWGVSLISSDVANLITGGFRVTVVEGTNVTTIYSKMSIVKVPDSSWPLADATVGSSLIPTSPTDSLWERISDVYYPKYLGDNVDLDTGDLLVTDVTIRGTLYGGSSPFKLVSKESDIATGVAFEFDTEVALTGAGSYLQKIKNFGVDKWVVDKDGKLTLGNLDADLVNITGTYGNIPSSPCNLETAISELSSAIGGENIWDRAGAIITPHIAGDDLNLGTGDIILSGVVDGRDISSDGAALDLHLTNDALIKHDADQIDVLGTYSKLPNAPGDLETIIADINAAITSESIWDRTGTAIVPQTAGDDLNLGTGDIILSGVVDGRDVSVDGGILDAHVGDASIHYVQTAIDHGNLLGRGDDDHVQYSLVDGSRSFTGTISGISPSSNSHLATKGYVDSLIQGINWQESVLNRTLVTSPPLPSVGDRYIVAGLGGDWSGFTVDDIVEYNGSTWDNLSPVESFASWVEDEDVLYVYSGVAWIKFGSTVDHGNLIGLGDDDHTQYLLTSGTRAMSGDFDMGSNNIVSVGSVDGRDVSVDGSTLDAHLNGGASKHDASEIDVEGVYTYISTGDLESAIGDIDSELGTLHGLIATEDIWNRVGTVISPKTAGDDLNLGAGQLTSGAISATSLVLSAGMAISRTATAVSYNVLVTDHYIGVTSTAAPRTIQLMSAIRSNGKIIIVKDESGLAGTNNIAVTTEGAETIDGAANYTINVNYGAAIFVCDGTNWFVL